jgi:isopenicillin N synthase-like dioxygenase
VRNRQGKFVPAPPIPGTIVVNAADLLARWSNDSIKSTEHRVVSPPVDSVGEVYPARYSIPFFCNPNMDALIECLACCKSAENPAKYAPILSGDHLVERLATTYL